MASREHGHVSAVFDWSCLRAFVNTVHVWDSLNMSRKQRHELCLGPAGDGGPGLPIA